MCHQRMPEFIYNCTQCHLQICRRCRQNRLWERQSERAIILFTAASKKGTPFYDKFFS
jgi:hypothetical protein